MKIKIENMKLKTKKKNEKRKIKKLHNVFKYWFF